MNIHDMHVTFRTIAQQMGMHLYRAILPESIDTFINNEIHELTQNIINSNVSEPYKDKITHQDNKISPVNALRTLVKNRSIGNNAVYFPNENKFVMRVSKSLLQNPMYYSSFSIIVGNKVNACRFVENDRVSVLLRDYCNAPTIQEPIIVLADEDASNIHLDIYVGGNKSFDSLNITYLKNPEVVNFNNSVDCDLPEHLHHKIVELAVTKYVQSVNLSAQTIKEQK